MKKMIGTESSPAELTTNMLLILAVKTVTTDSH